MFRFGAGLLGLLFGSVSLGALAQLPAGNWQYAWGDDFSGTTVDTGKWNVASPSWTMPNSLSTASASWVEVGGGLLTLDAIRTSSSGTTQFSSGSVSTYQKQTFTDGYLEARILLPTTPGSWPAFWGLYTGWPPEADLMEFPLTTDGGTSGYLNSSYHTAFHYTDSNGNAAAGAGQVNPGVGALNGAYHNFGMKWVKNTSVTFYLDGVQVSSFTSTNVAQMVNMYLIFDYAVGGWPGTPSTAQWPIGWMDRTKIDWVRVWKSAAGANSDWAYAGSSTSVLWDTAANWNNGVPNLGGIISSFGTVTPAQQNIDWSGSRTLSVINLDGNTRYRFGSSSSRLVLGYGNSGSLAPAINLAATTAADQEVNARLEWSGTLNIANNSSRALLLTGPVLGGDGITINGPGVVSFDGTNSYSGNTVINSGTQGPGIARARGKNALGVGGTVVIGEQGNSTTGRLELENNSLVANNISFNGRNNASVGILNNSGTNTIAGTVGAQVGGGTYLIQSDAGKLRLSGDGSAAGGVALQNSGGGTRAVTLQGNGDGEIDGAIADGAGVLNLVKSGAGTWTLGGPNTATGTTTVSGGTLVVNGATGSGTTTVAGGATLGGRGVVRGNLTAQSGATVRIGGDGPTILTNVLIDDFSGSLAAYTATRILDNNGGATNTCAWLNPDGSLKLTTTIYDGIEQWTLTRADFTLGVGQEIRADYHHDETDAQDIGLYAGAGTPTTGVRQDFVNIYVRNDGNIYSRGFNGTTELTLAGPVSVIPEKLFIARTAINTFQLGYYNGAARVVVATRTMSSSAIGNVIGFYADVRSIGTRGSLDNLCRLAPSNTNILSETLTVAGNCTLNAGSALEFDLFNPATYDRLTVAGQFTAGGTLRVTLGAGASAPVAGDTYNLIQAGTFTGAFTSNSLPALSPGLAWNTSDLSHGVLSVVSAIATNPTNITCAASNGLLTLAWPDDHTGWRLQAQTNPPAAGLGTNWVTVPNTELTNRFTAPLDPDNGSVFYRLIYQ
jgi:autotransporter-associated beta strand protein